MRTFLAFTLDPAVVDFLRGYLPALRAHTWARQVRWTAEAGWHITLRFLGNVTPVQVAALTANLERRAANLSAPVLRIGPPAFFPRPVHPRVVAAHVSMDAALRAIFVACEEAAVAIGLPPKRRGFYAHITLGRCKTDLPLHSRLETPPGEVRMIGQSITLFKSDLQPSGPIYTTLATFTLGPLKDAQ